MPSPFPGMNPYLEDEEFAREFHHSLSSVIQEQLIPHLRPKYRATVESTIVYEDVTGGTQHHYMWPDVSVLSEPARAGRPTESQTVIDPPTLVQPIAPDIEVKLLAVQIYTTQHKQLVTSIEILSRANKVQTGKAYRQYLRKRKRLLNSAAHVMELDLLRAGPRVILGHKRPKAAYFATLSRAKEPRQVEIWAMPLGQPLPILPVPLLSPDPDVPLDLNRAIDTVYDRGGYDYVIDYRQPPPPPLSEAEQKVVEEIRQQID